MLLSSVNLGWSYFPPSFFFIRAWKSIFDNQKSWIKAHWSENIAHKISVPKRKCHMFLKDQNLLLVAVKGKQTAIFWHLLEGYWKSWERWGENPPHLWTFRWGGNLTGGRNPPQGRISLPLENMFTKNVWTLFVCTAHKLDNPPALNHSCVLNLEWSQWSQMMFLTLKIEKISKRMMSVSYTHLTLPTILLV